MHILIGFTLYNNMPVETFMSWNNMMFDLLTATSKDENFSFSVTNTKGMVTDQARNNIVSRFLHQREPKCDYLLFLDSDMIFPSNLVERLLDLKADIATGLAFKKWYPHQPTIYKLEGRDFVSILNYPQNKVIKIDGCGMACVLIKRKVFEKIPEPWFEFKPIRRFGRKMILSEDLVFCKKAKKVGFTIKCDTSLVCGHVGGVIDERTYQGVRQLVPVSQYPIDFFKKLKKEAKK